MRAGLELWPVGSDSDPDLEPESDAEPDRHEGEQNGGDGDQSPSRPIYPRRAAGERAGDGAEVRVPAVSARAEPFRWHAHGLDGAGVYLLISGQR
jgi:hypothetical protein